MANDGGNTPSGEIFVDIDSQELARLRAELAKVPPSRRRRALEKFGLAALGAIP